MNLFKIFFLFILGHAGSSWPHIGFLWLWQVETTLVVVSLGGGVPCCRAQALERRLSSCDYPTVLEAHQGKLVNEMKMFLPHLSPLFSSLTQ